MGPTAARRLLRDIILGLQSMSAVPNKMMNLPGSQAISEGVGRKGLTDALFSPLTCLYCSMMWRGAGIEVVDLGVNVSADEFVTAARERSADVVGISALLTTTMMEMKEMMC